MQDRKIYERSLSDYPDVLTVPDLQRALDGMCEKTIRGIIWRGEISSFKIGTKHMIPKESFHFSLLYSAFSAAMLVTAYGKTSSAFTVGLTQSRIAPFGRISGIRSWIWAMSLHGSRVKTTNAGKAFSIR